MGETSESTIKQTYVISPFVDLIFRKYLLHDARFFSFTPHQISPMRVQIVLVQLLEEMGILEVLERDLHVSGD